MNSILNLNSNEMRINIFFFRKNMTIQLELLRCKKKKLIDEEELFFLFSVVVYLF